MTMASIPTEGGWTITAQRETQELPPGGQTFQRGMLVTFTTAYGVVGSVFVPYTQYNPQYVATLVSQRAALLDSVSALNTIPPAT